MLLSQPGSRRKRRLAGGGARGSLLPGAPPVFHRVLHPNARGATTRRPSRPPSAAGSPGPAETLAGPRCPSRGAGAAVGDAPPGPESPLTPEAPG